MGIADPTESAGREYEASVSITTPLSNLILQQQQDISYYAQESVSLKIKELQRAKDLHLNEKFERVKGLMAIDSLRGASISTERRALAPGSQHYP